MTIVRVLEYYLFPFQVVLPWKDLDVVLEAITFSWMNDLEYFTCLSELLIWDDDDDGDIYNQSKPISPE